jgi:hypothetical protein
MCRLPVHVSRSGPSVGKRAVIPPANASMYAQCSSSSAGSCSAAAAAGVARL